MIDAVTLGLINGDDGSAVVVATASMLTLSVVVVAVAASRNARVVG